MAIKIGDVYSISTSIGNRCFQVTHNYTKPPRYGYLIRVFKGEFTTLEELAQQEVQFSVFFPVKRAFKMKLISFLGNAPVSKSLSEFPVFKDGNINPATKKVDVWWLWDGEHEKQVGQLSDVELNYPIPEIINDTLLIERIEAGWTARDWGT
ncbi:MAG: hypothetical protein CR997_11125 [Acidobacteria bacterium]|nr:MAG: hypothetical protein CR997_11125 [Acidobacteriota bacterium]